MKKNMKVLVVDDNKEGRLLLSKILTSSNYEVKETCNGIDALESLKTSKPDLIISDILMPEMDGFTLLRELKKDSLWGKIPVVLYSAQYVNEKDKELAEKLGASGFITKPAEPKDIIKKIQTVLEEFGSAETKNVKSHLSKDEEYLGEYAERVFRKLEDKVKELEQEIKQRKIAEELLKLSEEKYRDIFENANDAICIVGADFKFKDINTKTLQLTGYSKEELIRMSVFDLIPPEQASRSKEEFKKLREKGNYEKFIGKTRTKSGNLIDVEVNSSAIIEDGRIIGSRDILRDITERKKAEMVIKKSEARLKEAQRVAHIGNWEWKPKTNELYWSDENYHIFGLTPDISPSLDIFFNIIHPDDLESVKQNIDDALNKIKPYDLDIRIIKPDSSQGYIHAMAEVDFDEQGIPSRMYGTVQDVSERKKIEEELLMFKLGIERSNEAIFITHIDGEIIYINPAFEKIYGFSREQALGKKPNILKSGLLPPEAYKSYWDTLLAKKVVSGELINKTRDGRFLNIEGSANPILNNEGNIIGFLAIQRDITQRKWTQDALRESEARLQDILDNSSTVVFLKDLDGRYITVNRRYEELFHVTRQTVVGKSDYDIFPREHADRFRQHDLLTLEKGGPFEIEEFVPHDDGQHVYISVKFPLFTGEKKPYAVCGIATDITDRKHAEEKIQRRSEDFASLFYISKTLAEAPDLKTVLQKTTDSITELMRLKRSAIYLLEGDSIYLRATTPPLDPQMSDSFRRAKLSDHPHIRESMSTCKPVLLPDMVHADLTLAERDISEALGLRTVLYLPLIVEGNAVGTLNVAAIGEPRDISNAEIDMCYTLANLAALNIQKAQLYESIQHYAADLQCQVAERMRAEEKIAASLKEKEILLREIHHRVKNNMQIISSLLGLESETIKDKKYVDMFRESQNRINSMSLIHEKLYRSRDLAKIELKEYIKDLANAIFQSRGVKTGTIVLNINIENAQLGIDQSIPLGLILNELITNSLKYAFPGDRKGEINVSLHLIDENTFELEVCDNGAGIPHDVDFRKTESLGLRLVTLLVENQLKGKIDLDRSKGTEFNIKFQGK